jgi:hypothetical protein
MKLSTDELHARLDALLAEPVPGSDDKDLDPFWEFVAALAQGRGVAECFHEDGLETAEAIPDKKSEHPGETADRKRRAYNIRVLQALVLAADRNGQASFLPGNFEAGVIAADLLAMLEGNTGQGLGKPQILFSNRDGEAHIRRRLRFQLVNFVYFTRERDKTSLTAARGRILPGLPYGTWKRWQEEYKDTASCSTKDIAKDARKAARCGENQHLYAMTSNETAEVFRIAYWPNGHD